MPAVSVAVLPLLLSLLVLSLLQSSALADPAFSEYDDACPEMNGKTQWQQMMEFWRQMMNQELWRSDEELIEMATTRYLYNIAWPEKPDNSQVFFGVNHQITEHDGETIVRIILTETNRGQKSQGGSTFRTDITSEVSKASCPYRDYFNGTYLICCTLSHHTSTIRVSHQHYNFTAYELFLGAANFVTTKPRRVNTVIWEKTLPVAKDMEYIQDKDPKCKKEAGLFKQDGQWMFVNEAFWKWVVKGCSFTFPQQDDVTKCFLSRYKNRLLASGESQVRDVFYYIVKEVSPTFQHMERSGNDLHWKHYTFKWETSFFVLENHLVNLLMDKGSGTHGPPAVIINVGEWPILSRPIGDYLLSMTNIIRALKQLKKYGSTVIWLESTAVRNVDALNKPSNDLIAALNYFICKRLAAAGITCVPYWKFTMPWADNLICSGHAHTMCLEKGHLQVIPPGHLAAQYVLKELCS